MKEVNDNNIARLYECPDNYRVYHFPKKHCVFCTHCEDYLYDDTNGPYMCFCELGAEPKGAGWHFECILFEDDGYVFDEEDYNKRMQAIMNERRKFKEMLENDPEFKKQYDEMFKKLWDVIMNGGNERRSVDDFSTRMWIL